MRTMLHTRKLYSYELACTLTVLLILSITSCAPVVQQEQPKDFVAVKPAVDEKEKPQATPAAEPNKESQSPTNTKKPAEESDNKDTTSGKSPDAEVKPKSEDVAVVTEKEEHPFRVQLETLDFPRGIEWLNTEPLSKKELKGKFVLLDFWTFCCINCMHILPELKKLEEQFPNELVVIGVHSAKFEGEKITDNIRDAIMRHDIVHPVINDSEHLIWRTYDVSSWPTIMMIDPEGKAVWGRSGEFKAEEVANILKHAIPYYEKKSLLNKTPLKFALEAEKQEDKPLRYPGKILADEKSNRLFIADSNHHRIVVATLDGQLLDIIGNGEIGLDNGNFKTATFKYPQGMALVNETLYVCDTENHALRKVDLKTNQVTTLAGTGQQMRLVTSEIAAWAGKPSETALNSPWDLWVHEKDLYIAMAGPHQIWKMPLSEEIITPFAGNGAEDIVDGALLPETFGQRGFSAFAQPSGLSSDGTWLYVADSEGSSVRAIPFDTKQEVRTVVGSNEEPQGRLFHFGDKDGQRDEVLLQHCLGVAYHEGKIYIADTYNNKIKVCDAKTGDTETFAGSGKPGLDDPIPLFDEPAGLSIAANKIYVADTNNHAIRVIDIASKKVKTLEIGGLHPPEKKTEVTKTETKPDFSAATVIKVEPQTLKAENGKVIVNVAINLPNDWKINPLVKPNYYLDSTQATGTIDRKVFGKVKLEEATNSWQVTLPVTGEGTDVLRISTKYYICQTADAGVCKMGEVVWEIPLTISATASSNEAKIQFTVSN